MSVTSLDLWLFGDDSQKHDLQAISAATQTMLNLANRSYHGSICRLAYDRNQFWNKIAGRKLPSSNKMKKLLKATIAGILLGANQHCSYDRNPKFKVGDPNYVPPAEKVGDLSYYPCPEEPPLERPVPGDPAHVSK